MNISVFHHSIFWQIVCIGLTRVWEYRYTSTLKNRSTDRLRPHRGIHNTRTDYIELSLIGEHYKVGKIAQNKLLYFMQNVE